MYICITCVYVSHNIYVKVFRCTYVSHVYIHIYMCVCGSVCLQRSLHKCGSLHKMCVCVWVCLSAWFSVEVCACLWVLKCVFYCFRAPSVVLSFK